MFTRTLLDPLHADSAALVRGRYGLIEIEQGELKAIHLRPLPKFISTIEAEWLGRRYHERKPGDVCWLYYDQPRWHPNYLALKLVVSHRDCTFRSFRQALQTLDEVARLKRADAILCDAWNTRISDRLLHRWGWQAHASSRWHRNFIKRFYGKFAVESGVRD